MEKNKLLTQPISRLIFQIAIPASVGFIFNTLYNVVDTYYAGLISTQALAALSLSFPVFFIIIALSSGLSTGATALIANALGASDQTKAKYYATQSIAFAFITSILLTLFGFLIAPWLFKILGAQGEYLDLAVTYINIIFSGSIFFLLSFVINSTLNAQGNTKTFRNVLVVGFFLNLILDPWFMFGGFGIPALGLAGVAWATVLIQFLSVIYISYKASQTGLFCRKCLQMLVPKKSYFAEIAKQGFPASLNMMTVALGIFVITYFVSNFGKSAVAAYGIATRIDQLALLPTIGLNIAVLTLVGQNNGAKAYKRCREAIRLTIVYGLTVSGMGAALIYIFARKLMELFSGDLVVVDHGVVFLKISVLVYFAYATLFTVVSALQGLKKPMYAIWIGIYRQLIAPIIVFYLLSVVLAWGILGIWWGIFAVNWSATIVTLIYLRRVINKTMPRSASD